MEYCNILIEVSESIDKPSAEVDAIYPPDQWLIKTGRPPVKAWYTTQKMAFDKGLIAQSKIGACSVMCFRVWDMVGLYEQALRADPFGLYGLRA